MKFEIGDKVVVKLTNEEGEVIDVVNDKMVMIEVRGVRFPAYTDQLDFPYFKRFTEKKLVPEKKPPRQYIDQVPKEKPTVIEKKVANGVSLRFLPKFTTDEFGDDVVELLKVHLVNETPAGYQFHYSVHYGGRMEFDLKNDVLAFHDFYLHDIAFADLSDNPSLDCEFILLTPDKRKAPHYETSLKLKGKQVFSKIEAMKEKGLPAFSYKLFDEYPAKAEEEPAIDLGKLSASGYKVYDAGKARQHLPPARTVVDLHMEKICDNWQHMDSFDILTAQLTEFEKYYELALQHRQPSLTIVHGVGSGRLRDEIHDLLKRRKEVKYFVNQYHAAYGYGATEIFFQY
jgi:hypothetical protein